MNKLGNIEVHNPEFLDAFNDLCMIIDRDFCIIGSNEQARRMFNLEPGKSQKEIGEVIPLSPDKYDKLAPLFHSTKEAPVEIKSDADGAAGTYHLKFFSFEAGKALVIVKMEQKSVSGYVTPEHCELINSLGELVALSYRNGDIFFRNRAFSDYFNLKNPERSVNFFDLLRFDNPVDELERLKEDFEHKKDFHADLKARSIEGKLRWLQWHITLHKNQTNGREVLQLSGRDVHNMRKAQEALKKSEQRFLDIANAAGEFFWETDEQMNFTYISDKIFDITGHQPGRLIGKPLSGLMSDADAAAFKDMIRSHKRPRSFKNFRHKSTHNSGRPILLSSSGTPILDEQLNIRGIRGVTLDITSEEKAASSLQKSKQNYELLFQQTPIGVFRYDTNMVITDCNVSLGQILSAPKNKLIGLDMRKLNDKRVMPAIFTALQGERGEYEGDYITTLSDQKVYINLQCVPFHDEDRKVVGGIGLVKDITKTYKAEQALKYQLELEMLALDISTQFINLNVQKTDDVINDSLQKIGSFTKADRCYLFVVDEENQTCTNTHEWVAENTTSEIENLQELPLSTIPYIASKIPKDDYIMIPDVDEMSDEAEVDQKLLKSQDIKSLLLVPIRIENELYGFFGFDCCRENRTWRYNEIIAFKQLGNSFASMLNRKSNETKLRNSEERFRSLVQNATDIITILDKNAEIRYNSPSFYRISGYDQNFSKSEALQKAIHPDDSEMAQEAFCEVLKNPDVIKKLEIRVKKSDGKYAYFESLITNQLYTPGIDGLVVNSREITDRKLAEIELKEKQNFISTVSETIPGILYVFDLNENVIIYRNNDFDKFLGYAYKPVFHLDFTNDVQIHPDDLEKALEFQHQIRTNPEFTENLIDFRVKSASGEYRWMLARINIFSHDEDGRPTQVLGLVQDITERKEFEETLTYITKAVEQSSDGVSVAAPDSFENIYQNKVFSSRLGYSSTEELNEKGGIKSVFAEPGLADKIMESVKTGKPWSGEVSLKPAHGPEFPALLRADAVRNDQGSHIGTVMIWSDITTLKDQEAKIRLNEQMLNSINTNVNEGIFRMTEDGRLIYANKAFLSMFGYDESTEPDELSMTELFLNPEDFNRHINHLIKNNSVQNEEVKLVNSRNENFWGMLSSIMVKDQNGHVLIDGVINDITSRKTSEIAQSVIYRISEAAHRISKTEELYEEIFVSLAQLMPVENYYIALADEENQMLTFPYFLDREDLRTRKRKMTNGLTEFILRSGKALAVSDDNLEQLLEDENILLHGKKPRSVLGIPLHAKDRTIGVIVLHSYSNDVTYDHKHSSLLNYVGEQIALTIERKRTEQLLEQEKTFANAIISSLPGMYFLFDGQKKLMRWNQNFEKITGFSSDQIDQKTFLDFFDEKNREIMSKAIEDSFENEFTEVEAEMLVKNGKKLPVYFSGSRVILNSKLCISGVGLDITERRKAEEQIKASLKEKKILLSEVHHRVKNNLAVITGLLSLQAEISDSPVSRQILRESEIRIRSMAMIHEKLYQTDIYSSVEFDSYVKDLSSSIQSMFDEKGIVEIVRNMNNLYLSLNKAIPCGLIINELLTNSFKHAFVGRNNGKVEITMKKSGSQIELIYHDDGVGLPDDFDVETTSSLGMKLIDGLSGQLGGSYSFDSDDNGTTFRLNFEETE